MKYPDILHRGTFIIASKAGKSKGIVKKFTKRCNLSHSVRFWSEPLAECRTSEESTAKPLKFAEISAKIVKYVQYPCDFGEKSALFSQFFVAIPKARQPV